MATLRFRTGARLSARITQAGMTVPRVAVGEGDGGRGGLGVSKTVRG